MHLIQETSGNFLINPTWIREGSGGVLVDDDGPRVLMRAGKIELENAAKRMGTLVRGLGLKGIVGQPEAVTTTVPGVGYCKAFEAPLEFTAPVTKTQWLECRGDCSEPQPDHGFTAWWLHFDIGAIMDVFRGRSLCVFMIRFLVPDANPYALQDSATRAKLQGILASQLKGFGRFKDAESWFRKQGPERIRIERNSGPRRRSDLLGASGSNSQDHK